MALSNSNIPLNAPDSTTPTTLSIRQAFGQTRTEMQGLIDAVNAGVQGPQGNAGAQGSQGPQGFQGAGGVQGSQGAAGTPGTQGAQGASGVGGPAVAHYGPSPPPSPTIGQLWMNENPWGLQVWDGFGWNPIV